MDVFKQSILSTLKPNQDIPQRKGDGNPQREDRESEPRHSRKKRRPLIIFKITKSDGI